MEDLLTQPPTRIAWTYFEQSIPRISDLQHVLWREYEKEAAASHFGREPSGLPPVATEMCHPRKLDNPAFCLPSSNPQMVGGPRAAGESRSSTNRIVEFRGGRLRP
jgi:hypothetical protein